MRARLPVRCRLRPIVYGVMLACADSALGNPTGAQVINGTVTMARPNAQTLNVTNTPGSIIHWQGFSIGAGETTRFIQQNASSTVLNRVVGADISQIYGQLASNGRVYLINPAGIIVGAGGTIDTAGFVGSSLNLTNRDFLAGNLKFQGDGSAGSVVNHGRIRTQAGGDVVLIAPQVENHGLIRTPGGEVILAAGRKVTIGDVRHEGVQFEVQAPTDSALNLGKLIAENGAVGVFAGTIRHSGDIRATSLARDEAGRVVLKGQGDVTLAAGSRTSADGKTGGAVTIQSTQGTTLVSGNVSAQGTQGEGGDVRILGNRVGLMDHATVNASGKTGGGQILVGGDYLGGNAEVQNAYRTFVGPDATLRADAITSGDGGKVIVWSDDVTRFGGKISARGGARSGEGGFVETSGKKTLLVGTSAHVDTRAPAGQTGAWLLDPETVNVSTSGTAPLTAADSFGDPGPAVTIHPNTINTASTNVLLRATDTITFSNDVSMTGAGLSLTAESGRAILVNANITTNNGDVRLVANHDHGGGYTPGSSPAQLTMATGRTIDAGTANVFLRMHAGEDDSNVPAGGGHITIANLKGGNVSIFQNARATPGHSILRVDGTSLITATTSVHLEVEDTTGAASIGTSAAPIRIDTPAVEAHSHNATGGIFLQSPNPRDLQIGGVPAGIYGGVVRGVQTLGPGAPIEITVDGALTRLNGGTDGPIVANNKNITLSAIRLGASGAAGRLHVDAGTGTVTATATGDGLFVEQTTGNALLSRYNLSAPTTQAVELATSDGTITVDANIAMAGRDVTLIGGGASGDILFNNTATVNAASLTLEGTGVARFGGNIVTFNAPLEINKPLEILGGTVNFNGDSTVTVAGPGPAFTLAGGTLTGTAVLTIDGTGNVWSGGAMSGTGTTHITGANTLTINGGGNKVFTNRTLTTDGTVTWTAGNVLTGGGGVFNNNDLFDIQGNVSWSHNAGSTPTTLNNAGTLRRSVGTGVAALDRMVVTGAGPIEVQSGTLGLSNAVLPGAGTGTLTGAITVANGATLDFEGGTYVVNNTISGAGNLIVSGATFTPQAVTTTGTLAVSSGIANFDANATPLTPSAATVSGGTANVGRELTTAGSLTISGGSALFTADATVGGSLQFSNGTLGGDTATVTINGNGSVWSAGTMSGTGTTHITGANTLTLNGTTKIFTNRTLTTDGTVTWTAGNVAANGGGTFNNNGVFDIQGDVTWFHNAGTTPTVLNNAGTLRRSVGTGVAGLHRVVVTGAGPIEVQSGTLSLSNNVATSETGTLTGPITVANGATLDFAGATYDVNNTISGAGNLIVSGATFTPQAVTTTGTLAVSSGIANFDANATPLTPSAVAVSGGTANVARELNTGGNLTISGGSALFTADATVGGSLQFSNGTLGGDTATVTINGNGSVWSAGTMSGTGTTHITGANTLTLNGTTKIFTNRTLTTDGTVTWTAGNVAANGGGTFNNNGVFDIQGDVTWFHNAGTTPTVLNNAGTLRRSVGTGVAGLHRVVVTGAGPIEVQSGTLRLSGNVAVGETGTLAGPITVANGTTLDFGGATYDVTSTISGAGNLSVSGVAVLNPAAITTTGTLTVSGGTANFDANATPLTPSTVAVSGGTANFGRTLATTGDLAISGGAANFTADATVVGTLQLSGGTLGGDTGTVTINGNGSVWSGGAMSGTGVTHITGVNALTINGTNMTFRQRTLTTDGTVTWTAGNVLGGDGGTFNNNGVFDIQGDTLWLNNFGGAPTALNNAGTLRRSGSAGAAGLDRMLVTGAGPVEVQSGTLGLSDGVLPGTGTGTLTGAITVANGATLDFEGATYVVNNTIGGAGNLTVSGATFTPQAVTTTGTLTVSSGIANFDANATDLTPSSVTVSGGTANFGRTLATPGNLTISGGGSALFTTDATVAGSLQLSGGTLGGDGATVTINGTGSVWGGGTMSGTGVTHITSTGANALAMNGATKFFTQRTLTTDGTVTWTAGHVQAGGGGTFNNNGVFDVQGNTLWLNNFGGAPTTLNNAGTLRRSASATEARFDMAFVNNTGTIDVQIGTLTLRQFPANDGIVNIAAGAVLSTFGNPLTNNAGGTIGGAGTLDLNSGGTFPTLTNDGVLRPGNASGDETGTLTIAGKLTQGATGRVNVQLGGTAAGDFDVLAVLDTAQLTGDLNLSTTNGYIPTAGHNFTVLTAGTTLNGAFANVNKTFGNSVTTDYNPTNLLLTLGAGGAINAWAANTDGNWNVPGNWTLTHVPTSGEEVVIDVGGGTVRTITVPAGTFLASNLTSNENIVIGGGSLSLATASTINAGLTVNSGTLTGAGQVTVNGNLAFTGGTIASTGGVIVNGATSIAGGNPQLTGLLTTNALNMTAGTLNIAGSGRLSLTGTSASTLGGTSTTLANAGTLRMAGTGNLQLNDGATLNNTGLIDIQTNAGFEYSTGGNVPTLTNSGTLRKSGGTGTSVIGLSFPLNFTNNGTLDAQTGTLEYRASNTFADGTQFTGAGSNLVTTNSTFTGTSTSANLTLQSGSFGGGGSLAGTTTWTGGTIAGALTIPTGATLDLSGTGGKTINSTAALLTNEGRINVTGTGNLLMNDGARLTNNGLFDFQSDAGIQYTFGGNVPVFTNAAGATLTKSAGTASVIGISTPFTFTNAGTLDVAAGATINYAANNTFQNGTQFTGAGSNLVTTNSTFTGTSTSANLTLQSGSFGGGGSLAGTTTWTGGTIAGALTIPSGATLDLSGTSDKFMGGVAASLTNNGTITVTGSGNLVMNDGPALTNNGLFDFRSDAGIQYVFGGNVPTFINNDTLRKSNSTGTSVVGLSFPFNFTNNGTLDAQTGTLEYRASNTFADGTQFIGAGSNLVTTNSTFTGTSTSANLTLQSGSFGGGGSLAGTTTWTGGTIAGALTISNGATLDLSGTGDKFMGGVAASLTNNGTITVTGSGNLVMNDGPALTNNGLFDFRSDAGIQYVFGGNVPTFINNGTLTKSAGAGTSAIGISNAFTFSNTGSGTIHVQTGTLQVNGGFPANDGTINVDAGATFSTNNNSLINNGTIGGAGTIALNTGTLTNQGTLRPGNATGDTTGTLTIASNLTQSGDGRTDVQLGGIAAGDFDVVAVSGNANLAGTLNVSTTGGYVASGGDNFTVLTAGGARNGTFDTVNQTFGNTMNTNYNPASVVLALGGAVLNQWTVGDGDWSISTNWSRGHVPNAGERVVIDVDGTTVRTITVPAGVFAANRITSEENFVISGGDLTLGNASTFNGAFTLNSGSLRGAGVVTVNGAFNWNGGAITGPGAFNTHGVSTLAGGLKTLTGRTWSNFGTVNWTDGNIRLSDTAATINNKPGATWNVLTHSPFTDMNGPGTFNNEAGALIEANAPGLSNSLNPDTVNHAGTINLRRGDLDYDNLSTVNFSGPINFSDGTRIKSYTGPGTTLNFNAGTVLNLAAGDTATLVMDNHAINVNSALTLPSGMRVDQSTSTLTANAPLTFASGATYNLTGGSLAGSGLVTLNDSFDLNGGVLANTGGVMVNGTTNIGSGTPHLNTTLTTNGLNMIAGTLNIGTSGTLNLDGGAAKTVNGATVNNQGTINLAGTANLMLENGATLVNDNTIDLRSGAGIRNSAGTSTFDNAGTLRKTAGTPSVIDVDTFNNHIGGSILVQAGTLQMVSGFPTNRGTIDVAPGTTFSTVGSPLVNEGVVRGHGTIDLGAATLTNNGTVAPGSSPGRLTINGNFTQGPLGTLAIDLGGTQQGVTYDLFQVTGMATLGGTLQANAAGSYMPGPSDAFDVMTYSSRSGDFATVNTPTGSSLQGTPHATFYRLAPPGYTTSPTATSASTVSTLSADTNNVIVSEVERLPTLLVLLVEKPKPEAKTERICN